MATIGDMTVEELKQLITETIVERLTRLLGDFDMDENELWLDQDADTRTWEEVKLDIERHRWTPPPGAPSVTELLREDRES